MSESITGQVFDIQRFSIHDGPGIRTTVFMKGCPLRCIWCHNPEGVSAKPELSFAPDLCIGCGYCFRVCPNDAHCMADGRHVLDRDACAACGICARECYAEALEFVGRSMTVPEVLDEVVRDRPFYETSGGGMTLSGGEPLHQIDFAEALLRAAQTARIDTCVETCGFGPYADLERLRPYVALFLYDLKETDANRHKTHTGVSNDTIIENLRTLHAQGARDPPTVPDHTGYNDRPDHFKAIAALVHSLPHLDGIELMPYHALSDSKLARFGIDPTNRATPNENATTALAGWIIALQAHGVTVTNEPPATCKTA